MRHFFTKGRVACLIIIIAVLIDQIIKVAVKTNMSLHETIRITDWFYINFIENNGMAYGMTLVNKLVLSSFRIVAVIVIGVYLFRLTRQPKVKAGYMACIALVMAGALGNIIDCLFYGLVFDESTPYTVSSFVKFGEGYSSFLHGKVVDMFYFPLIETDLPQWLPIWGGEHYIFFSPVFNFADSCITVSVILLLLFYREELSQISFSRKKKEDTEDTEVEQPEHQ